MQGSRRVRWWVAVLATAVTVVSTAGTATAAAASASRAAVPRAAAGLAVGSVVSQRSFAELAQISGAKTIGGDFNGDGLTDLALTGGTGWASIPVGLSNGDGTFTVTNETVDNFPGWAQNPDAKVTAGDFNDDDRTDLALTGGAGWNTIPLATSNGDGTFTISNPSAPAFAGWAQIRGAKVTAGNFTNDTRTDLVITGVAGFSTIPLATATANGTFTVTNQSAPDFAGWAQVPGVTVTAGTFNNDTRTDLALTGGTGWNTIPMATSNANGTFTISNPSAPDFAFFAQGLNVKVSAGNFTDDNRTDLALTGGASWTTIPLAVSNTNGTFTATNQTVPNFPGWAQAPGAKVIAGNFNDDNRTDLALVGGAGWDTIPIAYPTTTNTFTVTNQKVTGIPHWAQNPNATITAGNFNTDQHTDLLITGNRGTSTLPTALSNGANGTFTTPPPPTPTPLEAGTLTLPDPNDASGVHSSVAIGTDGLPIIANHVSGNPVTGTRDDLRVSHCEDAACTAVAVTDIDTVGDVGHYPSIKIGADGLPLISYVTRRSSTAFTRDLKVAHCNNTACTSATVTTLDAPSFVDSAPSLIIGADGLGHIAYRDAQAANNGSGTVNIKVAHCNNVACSAATQTIVDTPVATGAEGSGGLGAMSSMALGANGLGILAYIDAGSNQQLKVAACTNAACTTKNVSIVDGKSDQNPSGAGSWPSVAIGTDGLPLISYNAGIGTGGTARTNLKVAHCLNLQCTQSTTTTADTSGVVGWFTSITIGGDGLGAVAHTDDTNNDLKLTHCNNLACTSITTTTIDAFDGVGPFPSIATGADGLPLVAYQGPGPNGGVTLHVMQCPNVDCTGIVAAPF